MKSFVFFLLLAMGLVGTTSFVQAQNAVLYFLPATGTFTTGQTFTVTVMVDTKGQQVNAVGAYFTYPENLLQGISLDTTGSVLDTFTPEKTVAAGKVEFAAAKQPPPVLGIGKLFSVTFRAKTSLGAGQFAFTQDSAVLTHGESKNILSLPNSGKMALQIVAPPPPLPPTPTPTPTPTPPPAGGPKETLVISDIKAKRVSEEGVLLSWKTNEATRGRVNYGPSARQDYKFSVLDGTLGIEHSLLLSDVIFSEDYSLEIIGTDAKANQVAAESLILADLLEKESEPNVPGIVDDEIGVGGFKIRLPMLFIFVVLPILVILLAAFLVFRRMRSREGGQG